MLKPSSQKSERWMLPLLVALTLLVLQISASGRAWSRGSRQATTALGYGSASMIVRTEASSDADLSFGEGAPGDGPVVVAPGDSSALQIQVAGIRDTAYQLDFPYGVSTSLDGGSSPDTTVQIYKVETSLSGSAGVFPADGSLLEASIGATRDSLRLTQQTGVYTGDLPITLVYF